MSLIMITGLRYFANAVWIENQKKMSHDLQRCPQMTKSAYHMSFQGFYWSFGTFSLQIVESVNC